MSPGRTGAQPAGAAEGDRPAGSPPPGRARPGPTPVPGEHNPTSLYRGSGQLERTQVYPGGAPPGYASGAPAGQPGPVRRATTPPRKRSGLAWVLLVLVVIALVVLALLVAVALG